jgi:DNA-binding response OmpR family regulator
MVAGAAPTLRTSQTILVVEDNPNLLEVLGMLLDYERFCVAGAADGRRALEWLAGRRPALVILDWLLPGVAGAEVLAAIRGRYGAEVPVLVLSAVADGGQVLEAGADAFLRKPYVVEELVGAIHRLLEACAASAGGTRAPAP